MNKQLLSALSAMCATELSSPAMARDGADDPAGHLHQDRGHDDHVGRKHQVHEAEDAADSANEDRRGKNALDHGHRGRRATDLPKQDDRDNVVNPASHQ